MWVCFSFVILSLLEFALADYWNQRELNSYNKAALRNASATTVSNYRTTSDIGSPFGRYLNRNTDERGSGIVHHNCSNCDPPEKERVTLLTNNNSVQNYHNESTNCKSHSPMENHHRVTNNGNFQNAEGIPMNSDRSEFYNNRSWAATRRPGPDPTSMKSAKIDMMARWIFPTSFFIFNVIYWCVISWNL